MRRHIYYTLQSLLHKQGSNAIKIISLALGLLMSVFLFARIAFELSFDNFYHDSDNLYIVKTGWLKNGVLEGNESRFTIIPIPVAIAGSRRVSSGADNNQKVSVLRRIFSGD